jgi:hypothetical protein
MIEQIQVGTLPPRAPAQHTSKTEAGRIQRNRSGEWYCRRREAGDLKLASRAASEGVTAERVVMELPILIKPQLIACRTP